MAKNLIIDRIIFNALHWGTYEREQGIMIASEEFPYELRYVVRKNELLIMGGGNGAFCLDLTAGQRFADEVKSIADCYNQSVGDLRPKNGLGGADLFEQIQGKKTKT
ncbi:MAG: hypothetical protein AB7V37_10235 [Eubacteriaceae bacterium]